MVEVQYHVILTPIIWSVCNILHKIVLNMYLQNFVKMNIYIIRLAEKTSHIFHYWCLSDCNILHKLIKMYLLN